MDYKSYKFKHLQTEWYHKLQSLGFKDEELSLKHADKSYREVYKPLKVLKHIKRSRFRDYEDTLSYYQNCQNYLASATFLSDFHHKVWELHTKGLSLRKIVATLAEEGHFCSVFPIFLTVRQLKLDMFTWLKALHKEEETTLQINKEDIDPSTNTIVEGL